MQSSVENGTGRIHENRMNDKELSELPKTLRMIMIFIDRVGFPVMAFLLMFYLCFKTLRENTEAILQVRDVMTTLNVHLQNHER